MKKIASPLFQDLSEAELDTLAAAGHLRTRQFAKHEVIFRAGSCVREIGIVLRGSVHIENLDLWGTKSILSSVGAGQAFAETYAFCGEALMVDAVAAEHCEILFLHTAALTDARIEPALKDKLLRRLLAVSMRKNLSLSQRIFCTTPKTVRGRLLTYFSAQAARCVIPLSALFSPISGRTCWHGCCCFWCGNCWTGCCASRRLPRWAWLFWAVRPAR